MMEKKVCALAVLAALYGLIGVPESRRKPRVPYGYKFIDGNVGVSGKKITLPHYMAMFI